MSLDATLEAGTVCSGSLAHLWILRFCSPHGITQKLVSRVIFSVSGHDIAGGGCIQHTPLINRVGVLGICFLIARAVYNLGGWYTTAGVVYTVEYGM